MQINIVGAQRRPENSAYYPLVERSIPPQKSSGTLSRHNLRQLVASMVD